MNGTFAKKALHHAVPDRLNALVRSIHGQNVAVVHSFHAETMEVTIDPKRRADALKRSPLLTRLLSVVVVHFIAGNDEPQQRRINGDVLRAHSLHLAAAIDQHVGLQFACHSVSGVVCVGDDRLSTRLREGGAVSRFSLNDRRDVCGF